MVTYHTHTIARLSKEYAQTASDKLRQGHSVRYALPCACSSVNIKLMSLRNQALNDRDSDADASESEEREERDGEHSAGSDGADDDDDAASSPLEDVESVASSQLSQHSRAQRRKFIIQLFHFFLVSESKACGRKSTQSGRQRGGR